MAASGSLRVGFIGLGTMGAGMAVNLQKAGHALVVHDSRRAAAEPFLAAGAAWAATAREVAASVDILFTSLPGPPEVESVAFGTEGIIAGAAADLAWFDLSTNAPATLRKLHAALAARDAHLLDAPVSGGPKGAASGRLAIWVGGEEAVFARHEAVLRAIGDQVRLIGPFGSATVAKLAHNLSSYAFNVVMAEVFAMGMKAGVEPLTLWAALRQGAMGRRRTFEALGEQFLQHRYDPPFFALRLAHKDVALAVALGKEVGVPMRFANLTLEEMTEALGRGWGDRDSRTPMLLQQERAGIEIRVPAEEIRAVLDAEKKGG